MVSASFCAIFVAVTDLIETECGEDAIKLYEAGLINQHSIGFSTLKSDVNQKTGVRTITELKLYEGSAVLWGANPETPTLGFKGEFKETKRISRNIHAVYCEKSINLLLMSDLHWDNPKCDRELLKNHLDEAVKRDCKIILNGDTFCIMQGKYDPRRSKKDIRPEHNKANYIDAVIHDAVDWFAPYKDHILLVGYGNHETAILKALETDPVQRFVDLLNTTHGANLYAGGYGGVVDFKFQLDAFVPPKPFASWVLNNEEANWEAPVPHPADYGIGEGKKMYSWDEETVSWKEIEEQPA